MPKKKGRPGAPDPGEALLEEVAAALKQAAFEHPLEIPTPGFDIRTGRDVIRALAENPEAMLRKSQEINERHTRDLILYDWEIRVKFTFCALVPGGFVQLSVASLDGRALPERVVNRVKRAFFSHGEQPEEMEREFASPVNPHTRQFMLMGRQKLPDAMVRKRPDR